jgi:hypothetical protein
VADLAQPPLPDQLGDAAAIGVEAQLMVNHMDPPELFSLVKHGLSLGGVHGCRLLAEHVGAMIERGQGHGRMHIGGGGYQHEIELVIVEHGPPIVIDMRHAKSVCGSPGAVHAAGGKGDNFSTRHMGDGRQVGSAGEASADNTNFHGSCS